MQIQFNLKQLKHRCNAKISSFWGLGQEYTTKDGSFTYIDRGAKVLAVAHLDTVNTDEHFYHNQFDKEHVVYSTALDDRLGAYIILDLLPKLVGSENFDVLLTEGEESGRSTGFYFDPLHPYNWMFQFDRRGDDVVMYQYETKENVALLKDYGFKVGNGSFTDISTMDHLGVTGFNFGCGYYDNHSIRSYAELNITEMMVRKFVKFFKENKDTELPYDKTNKHSYNWRSWNVNDYKDYTGYGSYLSGFHSYQLGDCVDCGAMNVDTDEDGLCEICSQKYDDVGTNATSYSKHWEKCVMCEKWKDDVDEYGICGACTKLYEMENK